MVQDTSSQDGTSSRKRDPPPFPSQQMFILALCRICEPIAFMSIFPYAYYMILSFNLSTDTHQIALYVGLVTSAFAFAEFTSGVVWGRISDRIGRKPVLIAGLAGTAISMIVFGLAPNLPIALLGRALGGLLNGNMGVLQTTVAELVTVKEHQPRSFSIMPFVWCLGSILGPALGGTLAQPCKNFPRLFPSGTLFEKFPFLLPNLICAMILVCGVAIGILFLEETHAEKKRRRDFGLEVGRWVLGRFQRGKHTSCPPMGQGYEKIGASNRQASETNTMVEELPEYSPEIEVELPGYRSTDGTPRQSSSRTQSPNARQTGGVSTLPRKARGAQHAFTPQVIMIIGAFGILAYHSISFDQLMPVFLSEPNAHTEPSLPFYFSGGFGYSTKKIGFMLSVQGIYSMIAQLFVFPFAARRFGTLRTFRFVVTVWPLLYFLVPYTVLLPEQLRVPAVYLALLTKITFQCLAFPSTAILLTNAAPSALVLGTINGVSASMASLARACGPTLTGLLHSWGLTLGSTGLAWWMNGLICAIGAIESFWLKEPGSCDEEAEPTNADRGSHEALLDARAIEAAISAVDEDGLQLQGYTLHKSDSNVCWTQMSER